MPEQSANEPRYTISQVAKALHMSTKTVRAYYRMGIFPQPIREPWERGGYWLQWAVDFMKQRLDRTHEFRMPKQVRDLVEKLVRDEPRKTRRKGNERPTKLDQ